MGTSDGASVDHQTGVERRSPGESAPPRLDGDQGGATSGRRGDLDMVRAPPQHRARPHPIDRGGGDRQVLHQLDVLRPGAAGAQGGTTRSGDASTTPTAAARRNELVTEVTSACTSSPGSEWRTKTTRPSVVRATHPPPAAMAPVSSSMVPPTCAPDGRSELAVPSGGRSR